MLLIQEAIDYLITQIDLYLARRLGHDIKDHPPELILAEKLALKGMEKAHSRLSAEVLQSLGKIENESKELNNQIQNLQLKEEKDKEIDEGWLLLPQPENLKQKDFSFYKLSPNALDNNVDQIPLHFKGTWGDLMTTTYDDFVVALNNSLKSELITDNKMYILARFKRHLILLGEYAKKVLSAREKALQQQNEKPLEFTEEVDQWVFKMVNASINEAQDLLILALNNSKISLEISYLPKVTLEPGPGETEILLLSCKEVIEQFILFCQSVDNANKRKKYHPASMVDALPSAIDKKQPLMVINQRAARYLVENLFELATYHAYKTLNLTVPISYRFFKENIVQEKCTLLINTLHAFDEVTENKEEQSSEYWNSILNNVHSAQQSFAHFTPTYEYYMSSSKETFLWQNVHTVLHSTIPTSAVNAEKSHRNCKF